MSAARDRWLDEGLTVLEEDGAAGVRIDRLAARLGLSKGSFHHHFAGANGFKKELLDHVESRMTGLLEQAVDFARDEPSARRIFARLLEQIATSDGEFFRPRLETALRAWALTDTDAARTQARIDDSRLEVLRALWRRVTDDEEEVRLGALLPYVIGLGATVVMPPLSREDVGKLYERILPLVPDDLPRNHDTPA